MKKIVIIGAGPAGLTAAYCLLKNKEKYEVFVIEESQFNFASSFSDKNNSMTIITVIPKCRCILIRAIGIVILVSLFLIILLV